MIMDDGIDKWKRRYWPGEDKHPWQSPPIVPFPSPIIPEPRPTVPLPTQDEVDEFYRLLERARDYDRRTNQPDCEEAGKKKLLEEMAKKLGVKVSFPE